MATPEPTTKPTTEEVIQRLKESRPPATDRFTYLTIVDKSMSPEILPTLHEILQDVELTNDIGWDLVEMLIPTPGSEGCLETIARLGNPREVILKVLQVMETTTGEGENGSVGNTHFVTLCGMLGILHKRLQVKAPSRFLHTTLDTVYRSYDPNSPESTAAIILLLQNLSAQKRPPLPSRQSSTVLERPLHAADAVESAPDPEAEKTDEPNADETRIMNHLLQSFITCVIEAFVNSNNLEWAGRVLEYTYPQRIVPGRKTMMQAFNEVDELRAKDALVGQLAAVAGDLGFTKMKFSELREILEAPVCRDPLAIEFDPSNVDEIKISGGGLLCLIAYWVFAADIFDADQPHPDMYIFPDHQVLLKHYIGDDPQTEILSNPGTIEALVVLAVWLDGQKKIAAGGETGSDAKGNYMPYHHLVTLISVFHPNLRVRNASTVIAGVVLHSDPDEDDRLAILEDLLENCMFSSLQACAVTWLREEIIATRAADPKGDSKSRFNTPDCFDAIQYTLFPDLTNLKDADIDTLLEFWAESSPFHLQVANFALFLFRNDYKDLAPAGMAAAIEHRYVQPLVQVSKMVLEALDKGEVEQPEDHKAAVMELGILRDTLESIALQ
ncbi:YAP1-binding protein 1 [Conoideocrella luteorostrata]|uniref:YAP1-binding protein 1 n=1 Tax=Conoideocrella luteorostrata TaxID=1105319 RepID=A0AAJ0FX35_9HYPO|nr:YAP1-binding protein 1 [Conoideocrella luteorostrata]